MEKLILLGIVLCCLVAQVTSDGVTIFESSPSGSNLSGGTVIAVTGCGFRQFNTAVCIWDGQFYSPIHVILSDDLIYCETPKINKESFDVLPKLTTLSVEFDGDEYVFAGYFQFGPNFFEYTPFDGYINGGEEMRIVGKGFSDFTFANVTFDDAQCINTTIINDHEITCIVPPGEINQNAIVNVRFEDNPNYFFHFPRTYHYGPILNGIFPPCGLTTGGTRVTILGVNLDDPTLVYDADPEGYVPEVEIIYNNGLNRAYGLDIDFNPKNNLIVLTTPNIGSVFGNKVQFAVFFKKLYSKVAVTAEQDFIYGPIIYSSTPSSGRIGGGESITIYGCGLNEFPANSYDVFYNMEELCASGTKSIVSKGNLVDDYLTCITAPVSCTSDNIGQVYLSLTTEIPSVDDPQILPYPGDLWLTYQAGPVIDLSSISSTRGPRTGGEVVTIEGNNFQYSSTGSWEVTVNFFSYEYPEVVIPSVPATIESNTKLSFVTPIGLFDLDVIISFDFGSECLSYPSEYNPTYHFGPVCEDVTPQNGYWSGGSDVTVIGEGFEEDNNLKSDTFVRMCIERLSHTDCAYEEIARDTFRMNDTQIAFVTPSSRQNVKTRVGDNRLFGDVAQVWVHFYQPGGEFIEFPRNQLRPGLEVARIQCPQTYTFGPKVDSITPEAGQVAPRSNPAPLPVTVNGAYFDDPALQNDVSVFFGFTASSEPSITTDNSIAAGVMPFLTANRDIRANVIFDNGNRTYSGVNLHFGPVIYSIGTAKLGVPDASPNNINRDVYGLFPNGGEEIIVNGKGFSEFYSWDIKCSIGGEEVPFELIDDTLIVCNSPCRPYGSKVFLSLSFGTICGADDDYDWENTIVASQALYYNPIIYSFSPVFGKTSGGDSITIQGEGFSGWGKYECFFGHYSDQQHVEPSPDGTTVVCQTPINRAEFNSHVTVHVQLSAFDDDDATESEYSEVVDSCANRGIFLDESIYAGVENHYYKAWAHNKFYYGPVCNDISPSSCPLSGCDAEVVGTGFQDCISGDQIVYPKTYPYNDCTFRYYKVRFVDPVTKNIFYVDAPTNDTLSELNSDTRLTFTAPEGNCGFEPEIEIEFYNPDISSKPSSDGSQSQAIIKCSHPETRPFTFHYGPIFSSQSSTFYESSRKMSYGWTGDSITINGINFDDESITGVQCNFGSLSAPATLNGSSVVCDVPEVSNSLWNTVADVSVSWTGDICAPVQAEQFHFGPTIRSITPTRGYVAGEEPVTISGFAFECCGITSYSCLFPEVNPPKVDDTVYISENTVTCTVPKNEHIDVLINNIGVKFTSELFGAQDITFTEDNTSLKYYYGPIITGVSPDHSTLSGRDQFVVFHGEGFKDPYLIETFCDFINQTSPGFETVPIFPIEEVYITENEITCHIPLFSHHARAVDKIRPRWRRVVEELRPELNKNYYKTIPPTIVDTDQAPYFSDGGSSTPYFYEGFKYGPVITRVCAYGECDQETIPAPLDGVMELTVYFDSLRDFVSDSDNLDFGSEIAFCSFGDYLSPYYSQIYASPDNDEEGYVVCYASGGVFGAVGEISVYLNPLYYEDTYSDDTFHVKPYTTGVSRNWVSTEGYEVIVIYGRGFCEYGNVKCSFSNENGHNDATQGEITNDRMVTCRTPARAAGYSYISLQFGNGYYSCDFKPQDLIQVPDRITFYGITDVSPNEGSVCGGSTISYHGFGFHSFDRINCQWPSSAIQAATILSDNLFTCNSIDVSDVFDQDFVHCSQLSITGLRKGNYYSMNVPHKFEAGLPQLVSISPSTIDLTSFGTIAVHGLYLNGNGYDISCEFSGYPASSGTLVADDHNNFYVLCQVPSDITVGVHDFALSVGCATSISFRTNILHLTVTQTPIIRSVRPLAGPELGGQTITVTGSNFNGGTMYVCVFGAIAVGATFDEENNTLTCKTPAFLETDQDIKIPLYISLDGGETLFRSKDDYIYQNIAFVDHENVCVRQEEINGGSYLSISLFLTILSICISLVF